MTITRHFIDVSGAAGLRRVHYRKAGTGPPLLMVHQSPRSSAEYAEVMQRWAAHFTCIAPDTPGFGQSDPLPGEPDIDDFADANIALLDALGLDRVAAYGFHSGAIILVTALKRHPQRFTTVACGGYAVWTPEEMELFGTAYLPPFHPQPYGEHLVWVWNRVLEQSWFFPWFDVRPETRLPMANDDPEAVHAIVTEMLDAGNAYRAGYAAVLRAPRDIPPPDAKTPPVLVAAYAGDPLQEHIDRLGEMPTGWISKKVATPAELEAAALSHLRASETPSATAIPEAGDEGFVHVQAAGFDGLVHWRGSPAAERFVLPAPGSEASLLEDKDALVIDLPGHGLSDDWPGGEFAAWAAVAAAACEAVGAQPGIVVGEGASLLLAAEVARRIDAPACGGFDVLLPARSEPGWAERALPDITPDRHGAYLIRNWSAVRAEQLFWPWFEASAANAIPFRPEQVEPGALALSHRARIRARAGRELLKVLLDLDRDQIIAAAPPLTFLRVPGWARERDDIWIPEETK